MKKSETKNSLVRTSNVEQTIEQSELISNESPMIQPSSKVDSLSNINKKNKTTPEFTVTHFVNGIEIPKEKLSELTINSPVIDRLIALTNKKLRESGDD